MSSVPYLIIDQINKRAHSQKVGHLFFFALKGLYIPAQGIALGNTTIQYYWKIL